MILGFLIGILLFSLIEKPFNVIKNKDLEFPITHYFMYSLNEKRSGRWNNEDYQFSYNKENYQDRVDGHIDVIKSRLRKMGLSGWIKLSKEKLAVNWSNGTYDYWNKLINQEKMSSLYEYVVGNRAIFLLYYCQIAKVMLMFMLLFAIIKQIRKNNKDKSFIYLFTFGSFLFYLMWEVSSRYSLTFFPILILTFIEGLETFEKILNIRNIEINLKDNNKSKINFSKFAGILGITVIILTTFLGIINFRNYARKKHIYYDNVIVQYSDHDKIKISNNVITQTFIANKKFNSIRIKFFNMNTDKITHYKFILLEENGKEIYTKEFTSEKVDEKGKYLKFNLGKLKTNKNKEYTIKIYSEDTNKQDTMYVYAYREYEKYDVYPNGKLNINDEETYGDLTFKVQNKRKRTYTSKKIYIALMIIILSIEMFSFYPYIKVLKNEV